MNDKDVEARIHTFVERVEHAVLAEVMQIAIEQDFCSRSLTDIKDICSQISTAPMSPNITSPDAIVNYAASMKDISHSILQQEDTERENRSEIASRFRDNIAVLVESVMELNDSEH